LHRFEGLSALSGEGKSQKFTSCVAKYTRCAYLRIHYSSNLLRAIVLFTRLQYLTWPTLSGAPDTFTLPWADTNCSDANNPARLFGFLLGTATAGAGMYYYVVDEYRVSNQLLTEDIYALQSAVQRIEGYVRTLEEKVGEKRR
jgi:hypothetical protein